MNLCEMSRLPIYRTAVQSIPFIRMSKFSGSRNSFLRGSASISKFDVESLPSLKSNALIRAASEPPSK